MIRRAFNTEAQHNWKESVARSANHFHHLRAERIFRQIVTAEEKNFHLSSTDLDSCVKEIRRMQPRRFYRGLYFESCRICLASSCSRTSIVVSGNFCMYFFMICQPRNKEIFPGEPSPSSCVRGPSST